MVNFVFPEYLWGFTLILIPILIHLFHFRKYKTLYFSDVRRLKNLEEVTRKQRKLKHWLVLLSRIFFILFLVLAFAQPFIPRKGPDFKTAKKIILVDNRLVSEFDNEYGNIFLQIKSNANKILKSLPQSAEVFLLNQENQNLSRSPLSITEATAELAETQISEFPWDIESTFSRLKNLALKKEIFLISTLTGLSADAIENLSDSISNIHVIPVLPPINGAIVNIDSAWLNAPFLLSEENQEIGISFQSVLLGGQDSSRFEVKLLQNDTVIAVKTQPVISRKRYNISFPFFKTKAEWGKLKFEIYQKERLVKSFFVAYPKTIPPKILILNGKNPLSGSLFNNKYATQTGKLNSLSSNLEEYALVYINEADQLSESELLELKNYTLKGGKLFVIPSSEKNGAYRTLSYFLENTQSPIEEKTLRIQQINQYDDYWNGAFRKIPKNAALPNIQKVYSFEKRGIPLLRFENQKTAFQRINFGEGFLFLLHFPISKNPNFSSHNLYLPTLYQAAVYGLKAPLNYYIQGKNKTNFILSGNFKVKGNVFQWKNDQAQEFLPLQKIKSDGVYFDLEKNDFPVGFYHISRPNEKPFLIGVNNYLPFTETEKDITEKMDQLAPFVKEKFSSKNGLFENDVPSDKAFWKLCIIFALLFLGIEGLLQRLLK